MTQGYAGDSINPVNDVVVIHLQIDEGDEEIRLSEENHFEFITACIGAKRDIDVDAGELSSDDEKIEDELVFFPTTTR